MVLLPTKFPLHQNDALKKKMLLSFMDYHYEQNIRDFRNQPYYCSILVANIIIISVIYECGTRYNEPFWSVIKDVIICSFTSYFKHDEVDISNQSNQISIFFS